MLRLNDSGHRRLRERCCGCEKVFGLRFVDVAPEQFVYPRVAESESFRFDNSIYIGKVTHKIRQPWHILTSHDLITEDEHVPPKEFSVHPSTVSSTRNSGAITTPDMSVSRFDATWIKRALMRMRQPASDCGKMSML